MIKLQNITKSYQLKNGKHTVLNNISFEFPKNVNIGILGKNGAGKSTMMRIIGGSETPDSGKVIKSGKISWPIGFTGGFHGSLTGRANLKFTCRIYDADIKKVTSFVEDFTELGKFMDEPFKTYSSGMRAKLAFGLSMAIGFDYFLIDELTAVGDATFRQKSQDVFNERKKETTLLVVSHSISTIREYCDKVAVLDNGILNDFECVNEGIDFYRYICKKKS